MAAGSSTSSTASVSAGGKVANGLSANGMNSTNPAYGHGMSGGGGSGLEDGDNRTRNAKAQRRHREKRKAHLKALEESVQVLTAQLEDARRQLGQAAYFSSTGQRPQGGPMSPQSKDLSQLQAENSYLRDENADLRRQLYSYRSTYGHPPPPAPADAKESWTEVKSEGFAYPGQSSPRRQRGSGGGEIDTSVPSTAEGSGSNSSSNGAYPPIDHFTPMHQRSRSRVMSSSSAPSASPYLQSDPRAVDARYPAPHMRYEAQSGMYGAPSSHNLPRYDVQPPHHHQYGQRQEGQDAVSWPPESGPPPFASYPMGFAEGNNNEEWRQEHQS